MRKTIPTYLLLMLLPFWSSGQNLSGPMKTKTRQLNIGVGIGRVAVIDQSKSPLIYAASAAPSIRLGYQSTTPRSIYGLNLSVLYGSYAPKNLPARFVQISSEDINGKPTENQIPLQGNLLDANLNGYYLRRLNRLGRNAFYIGGSLSNDMIYPTGSINAGNPTNFASLAVNSRFSYPLNRRHALGVGASVAVLSVITRDPFDGTFSEPEKSLNASFFSKGSELRSFGGYHKAEVSLEYSYIANQRINLQGIVLASWQQIKMPAEFKSLTSGMLFQLNYKLGLHKK